MIRNLIACVAAAAMLGASALAWGQATPTEKEAKPMWVYVSGPSTGQKASGIYVMRMDPATGKLSDPVKAADPTRASYFWIHPNGKCVYAVDQVEQGGKPVGMIRAYAIESGSGKLVELNAQPTGGVGPCYVSLDHEGKFALAANYASGSVAVLPVRPDGKLEKLSSFVQHAGKGPNPKRQTGPYAHCFDFDPAEKFALACDLGTDQVDVYRFDKATGTLAAVEPGRVPPGSGPRHITFSKDARFAYVVNEMGGTVTAFAYDAGTGGLKEVQTISTLPPDYQQSDKDTAAEIAVHPSGRFLYASNRGHDSIVRFAVDPATGTLSDPKWTPSGGKVPRYFGIDPSSRFMLVANQNSDNVVVFRVDEKDGTLTPTGDSVSSIPSAMCIKFLAAGE